MMKTQIMERDTFSEAKADARTVLKAWNNIRGTQFAPFWRDFNWTGIANNIVPHCGVVDVIEDPFDFVYRFWGSAHVRAHGQDLTKKSVRKMRPQAEADSVVEQYERTLEERKPLLFVNKIIAGPYERPMIETSLRLPFTQDGKSVSQIFAYSDIREDLDRIQRVFTLESLRPA